MLTRQEIEEMAEDRNEPTDRYRIEVSILTHKGVLTAPTISEALLIFQELEAFAIEHEIPIHILCFEDDNIIRERKPINQPTD